MIRISTETKMKPDSVIKSAVKFFGADYGLKVIDQGQNCASFEGGGGSVSISSKEEKGQTAVEVVAQEWENPAQEFIRWVKDKRS